MPFIRVTTNVPLAPAAQEYIKAQLGQAITAIPGKSEAWLMVALQPAQSLWFKGSNEPAAMVEVSVFGGVGGAQNTLTQAVCTILQKQAAIPPARTYVSFVETPLWGWNGSCF